MYLTKRTNIKNWSFTKDEDKTVITLNITERTKNIIPTRVSYITEDVGYWRKANHIHKWFVDNCADSVDDCNPVEVTASKLIELKELCERVVSESKLVPHINDDGTVHETYTVVEDQEHADSLLPTQAGFFFGGTEYDMHYIQDCLDTIQIINDCIDKENKSTYDVTYFYEASW